VPGRGTIVDPRSLLERCFAAAVAGVNPERATRDAVHLAVSGTRPVHIIAVGKAAHAMAAGAVHSLSERGMQTVGGVIVAPADQPSPAPTLIVHVGDHPVPGARSLAAAEAVAGAARRVAPDDTALVLLSGGATALMAAPVPSLTFDDIAGLFEGLLDSGADITTMNAIRKRVLRWGAGRLAEALRGADVLCLAVSDVVAGDEAAFIGSGPCVPDSLTAAKIRRMVEREHLSSVIPPAVSAYLDRVHHQGEAETPKPGNRVFERVRFKRLLGNSDALDAAEREAEAGGCKPVRRVRPPLIGDARRGGTEFAARLVAWRQRLEREALGGGPAFTVAGGEPTVRLETGTAGRGGGGQYRAQAAAPELHRLQPRSAGITILAAGSDGRDGPTDAAGAVVDCRTWSAILASGRDPSNDLGSHDAYPSLESADALLRTGLTGTNVNDLVMAVVTW
jgi:glycerate 2-kinase